MEDLDILYLNESDGESETLKYFFGCQSHHQNKQNYATYFILRLGDGESQDRTTSDSSDIEWFSEEVSKKNNSNYIGGLIYCNWKNLAQKYKNEFILSFKQSVYFNIGQYQEAFTNALESLQENLLSLDLLFETGYSLYQEKEIFSRIKVTANIFMKVDDKLYLSKSISPSSLIQNVWCIKEKGSNQHRQINKENDFTNEQSLYYEMKDILTQNLEELILSDSTNRVDMITTNVREKYPILIFDQFYLFNMHFFKISGIF